MYMTTIPYIQIFVEQTQLHLKQYLYIDFSLFFYINVCDKVDFFLQNGQYISLTPVSLIVLKSEPSWQVKHW